ncbi:MAG: beta-lactamase family protein [Schleiferilactobacillus harbinensis]|jgi:CubicO group peptidase (beta-lactamase class C family)|nr:beta-lactamase family protein [Schleiferilactobacillus harbinensis]
MRQSQALINRLTTARIVPGCAYAYIGPATVSSQINGYSALWPIPAPLAPTAQFDLASLTKVVGTLTVFLQAVDQGLLTPDSALADFLPTMTDHRVTFRHLLTHTSGIAGYIPHRNELPAPALKEALLRLPVTEAFAGWPIYSDTNLLLTGFVLEKLYGAAIHDLITDRVLGPLGLAGATFQPDQAVPTLYDASTKTNFAGVVHDPKSRILGPHSGSAGLFSDLATLIRFGQWYLGQWAPVAAPVTQTRLQTLWHDWAPRHGHRSLGWDLKTTPHGTPVLFHTGFTGTFMALDRQHQQGLIVLTNRIYPNGHNDRFLINRERIVNTWLAECDRT